jgi:hypothetical protein
MDHRRVTGVEPAVARGALGCLRVVVVTVHDDVAADDDLTHGLPVGGHLGAIAVHHPQLARGDQLDALPGLDDGAFRRGQLLVLG